MQVLPYLNLGIEFKELLFTFSRCYSNTIQEQLPSPEDFPAEIVSSDNKLDIEVLSKFCEESNNLFAKSIAKRMLAIHLLSITDRNIKLSKIWHLLKDSILQLPKGTVTSSIGSQGFLSIPIMKYDENLNDFQYVRIHIWHDSLKEYFDVKKCETFSIHSHAFDAFSEILVGGIRNEMFNVSESIQGDFARFEIRYNNTLREVNKHTSKAVNLGEMVSVDLESRNDYKPGNAYSIGAGEFHRAFSLNDKDITATIFSFFSREKPIVKSFVLGPRSINESEINREMYIEPKPYLEMIDNAINNNE